MVLWIFYVDILWLFLDILQKQLSEYKSNRYQREDYMHWLWLRFLRSGYR